LPPAATHAVASAVSVLNPTKTHDGSRTSMHLAPPVPE
jgi:hypothetical protein